MSKSPPLRLGINVDHVATLRNARGGARPDPVRAALEAIAAGSNAVYLGGDNDLEAGAMLDLEETRLEQIDNPGGA